MLILLQYKMAFVGHLFLKVAKMFPGRIITSAIHARNKQKQKEIAFFFDRMPDSFIVFFGCNNKSDSENGRALHRIPFFNDRRLERVRRRKWMESLVSSSFSVGATEAKMTRMPRVCSTNVIKVIPTAVLYLNIDGPFATI